MAYGASFNNFYVEKGVPLLRIKHLRRNEIVVDEVVYLPENARRQLGNCFVCTNDFLSYYLNCGLIAKIIERNKIGAIQGNITIPVIKSLPILLPPKDKQKEIANHISEIRQQAQALKDKTKAALETAGKEIEEILLN